MSCILISIDLFNSSESIDLYFRSAAISVAIVGAALRALQGGLWLDGETEPLHV